MANHRFFEPSDPIAARVSPPTLRSRRHAGGHELADERVAENLPVAALRKAYLLCQSGARDAALTAFCDAFHDACAAAADAEAADCARAAIREDR